MDTHVASWTVYFEDTDAQGVVYHANYLKFMERSRSQLLADRGLRLQDQGRALPLFVVHEMHLKFLRPARLGETIEVHTRCERASDFRLAFCQEVRLPGQPQPLVTAEVQVVAVDAAGTLVELPGQLAG